MNELSEPSRAPFWIALLVAAVALVVATAALTATLVGPDTSRLLGSMMGTGGGMMGGRSGMMGSTFVAPTGPQPGEPGFIAGTVPSPRVVRVVAGPGYAFSPSSITVALGETVTFEVTTMGPSVHEFMVGPADAVAADREGTPEVADISMMQTRAVTYAFDGPGPYAFACHAPGHYEAGMRGSIVVLG